MFLFKSKQRQHSLSEILHLFIRAEDVLDDQIDALSKLANYFRPAKSQKGIEISLTELIELLKGEPVLRAQFSEKIIQLFKNRRFTTILADAGILQDTHFFTEVRDRLFAQFLPYQPEKDTVEYILNQVFHKGTDYVWVKQIPVIELEELAELFGFRSIFHSVEANSPLDEILNAVNILLQRVSGRALESEVLKMVPEYEHRESPFEASEKKFDELEKQIRNAPSHSIEENDPCFVEFNELMKQCFLFVDRAYESSAQFGISLRVNQNLLRIRQQLERISTLSRLLTENTHSDRKKHSIQLTLDLIKYNSYKNNIRKLIGDSTRNISFEITQHTAKTGEHYITSDKKEYIHMFFTALGGGVIVGILCIIKLLLSKVDASEFGTAFLYSMNYALGFIIIYLLGFTLATKQPAMTAAAIVKSIEEGLKDDVDLYSRHTAFAELFARLFRSQFIAFVGNVAAALPIALGGIYLLDLSLHSSIAEHKWPKLVEDISPVHSKAILHAGIAGIFLFLSGVISGNISNKIKHNRITFRIQENPLLKMTFGREKTSKLAFWIENKWAGIASNFWFGVFMGSTAAIGGFIGLDLDIRHITFAAGNLGLALHGSGYDLSGDLIFWSIIGIGIIGFINFIVSFALSLGLAMRSRGISIKELQFLFFSVWLYFRDDPWEFFVPRKHKN